MKPRKAMVLAAGCGTRIRPLSRRQPKALLPVWGCPALEHVLAGLHGWGVQEVLINAHYRVDELAAFVRASRMRKLLRINLSFEPCLLGTGGAIRRADWFFDNDPFWLVNADIAFDADPAPLLNGWSEDAVAVLWVTDRGPRTVQVREGRVETFAAARPATEGTWTFTGVHLVSPEVLLYLPAQGCASILTAYRAAMRRGRSVHAVALPGAFWGDIGSPQGYLDVHRRAWAAHLAGLPGTRLVAPPAVRRARALCTRGDISVAGFCAIGPGVQVQTGTRICDSVLLGRARICAHSRLREAVLGEGVEVGGALEGIVAPATDIEDRAVQACLDRLAWPVREVVACVFHRPGSRRCYTRLAWRNQSVLAMCYDRARRENTAFFRLQAFLQEIGFPVPRILARLVPHSALIVEDLGPLCLCDFVRESGVPPAAAAYERVIDAVSALHTRGTLAARSRKLRLARRFARPLYGTEHDLFAEFCLRRRHALSANEITVIRAELERLCGQLQAQPPVLLHRDLQSTNILIRDGMPWFIDFQGMRFGPAAYDLASLLYDPYVELSENLRRRLFRRYCRNTGSAVSRRDLRVAAVQRLIQAMGAYGRLFLDCGLPCMIRYEVPAARRLQRVLLEIGDASHLAAFCDSLVDRESSVS